MPYKDADERNKYMRKYRKGRHKQLLSIESRLRELEKKLDTITSEILGKKRR